MSGPLVLNQFGGLTTSASLVDLDYNFDLINQFLATINPLYNLHAWCFADSNAGILASAGVNNLVDLGTGLVQAFWTIPFATPLYFFGGFAHADVPLIVNPSNAITQTAASATLQAFNLSGVLTDPNHWSLFAAGIA